MKKLVKRLKINKLLNSREKFKLREKTRQNAENKQTFGIFLIVFPNDFLYPFYILTSSITPSLQNKLLFSKSLGVIKNKMNAK